MYAVIVTKTRGPRHQLGSELVEFWILISNDKEQVCSGDCYFIFLCIREIQERSRIKKRDVHDLKKG